MYNSNIYFKLMLTNLCLAEKFVPLTNTILAFLLKLTGYSKNVSIDRIDILSAHKSTLFY